MPLKVKFIGAVGAVTGSCHLLYYNRSNSYYMVDCGLYQNVRGHKDLNKARGEADLGGVPPAKIKAIFLTHAHMDHCGLIPRMYRRGFKGQVICTKLTADFVREALNDTVTNVDSFDRNLYDKRDVEAIQFYCPDEREGFQLGLSYKVLDEADLFFGFSRTGHLAGAVAISFETNDSEVNRLSICFGGDLGPQVLQSDASASLLRPVQYPKGRVDYLVLESTYGGQPARQPLVYSDKINALGFALERALSPGRGVNPRVIIPAFTLGRTQDLIADLAYLITRTDFAQRIGGRAPTVVVDSTLARSYSNSYRREFDNWWFKQKDNERKMRLLNRNHALFAESEIVDVNALLDQLFSGEGRRKVTSRTSVGSEFELCYGRTEVPEGPVIYLSSSGMCTSGPVMGRLRDNLRRPDATVMFVGYMPSFLDAAVLKASGVSWERPTEVAAAIQDGPVFRDSMRLEAFDLYTQEVKCALLDYAGLYSGHADVAGLCNYALHIDSPGFKDKYKPLSIFLVHGDDMPRGKLRRELQKYADTAAVGTCRPLRDIIIPGAASGWYDLASAKWESPQSDEPSWSESLKLLAEAGDLQESIMEAWFKYKSLAGEPVRQAEYLRRIDVLLDNLEQWRHRFRRLTQKALESEASSAEPEDESYDRQEVYLDTSSSRILTAAAQLLGLGGKITRAQSRMAWTSLCREVHPDSKPNATAEEKAKFTARMQEINAAQETLLAEFKKLSA
jgi:metallo-beta-lactamase family protein